MSRSPKDLETGMRALLPKVGGNAARAIRFMLSNEGEIAVRSMRDLAKRANVAPVNLVRVAQKLGFEGFDDFRKVYVDAVIDGRGPNLGLAAQLVSLGRTEGPLGFAAKFAEGEMEVQRQTIGNLKAQTLEAAVHDLVAADRIFVIGRRPFYAPAYSFAYTLRKAKPNVYLLDTGGGLSLELDGLTKNDVFVGFSAHPYSRITLGLARSAHAQGAKIIAITDSQNAPIGQIADHVFLTLVRSYAFPDSVSGAQLLANILVALTVSRLGPKALERIERNELEIGNSGEYVVDLAYRGPARAGRKSRRSSK